MNMDIQVLNNSVSVMLEKLTSASARSQVVKKSVEIEDTYLQSGIYEKNEIYDKNGNVAQKQILPERYNELPKAYIYYKGERMSYKELLEIAVETNAIELDENDTIFNNYDKAWETLVESKAKHLYPWSSSLYSEDGMYKFRVEDGQITGLTLARNADGVFFKDIVKDLANGIKPNEMSTDVSWLRQVDKELYDAACNIGRVKRLYDNSSFENKSILEHVLGFSVKDNRDMFSILALENYNHARYYKFFYNLTNS